MAARTLSGASVIILLYVLLSSVAALIGGSDPRLLLAKDSLVTAGFGLACLVSVLFGKPLMFYFGAKFATDGTAASARQWSGLWRYPDFRASQYRINAAWGIGFLVEAALRIAVAYGVSNFSVANNIVTILPLVFLAGLLTYTLSVARRTREAAMARRKLSQVADAGQALGG
jgi:intracellular septation protein A